MADTASGAPHQCPMCGEWFTATHTCRNNIIVIRDFETGYMASEIAALRAEVDALKADCLQMDALTDERDALRVEVERLKAWATACERLEREIRQRAERADTERVQATALVCQYAAHAERAEALLAKATEFDLERASIHRDGETWYLVWDHAPEETHAFDTLDAALDAYEQSRR